MTIIKNDAADAFVRKPPPDIRFFLVYGNDEGLIHERAKGLAAALLGPGADPMQLLRFEGDALARETGRLADEAYAISMFGGARVLWIELGSRDMTDAITALFERPPSDAWVVVEAGNLKKGTALRNAFERGTRAASVECYPDEKRALAGLIDAEARAAGLEVTPEAREYLMSLLGSDRLTSRGEVAKLMMYCRGAGKVEPEDVEAIVSDAAPSGLDGMVDDALAGDIAETEKKAVRFFADGGDAGALMNRMTARLVLLLHVRLEMDQGRSFDAALQGQFVKLPQRARVALAKQAEKWTSAALGRRAAALQSVLGRARRDAKLSPILATRALWTIAFSARPRRG